MSDITTWADGYGVWHARVPNGPDAHKAAKRAILRELRQREKLTPAYSVAVRCIEADPYADTVTYVEEIAGK